MAPLEESYLGSGPQYLCCQPTTQEAKGQQEDPGAVELSCSLQAQLALALLLPSCVSLALDLRFRVSSVMWEWDPPALNTFQRFDDQR